VTKFLKINQEDCQEIAKVKTLIIRVQVIAVQSVLFPDLRRYHDSRSRFLALDKPGHLLEKQDFEREGIFFQK
jgi:hypothetical protein